ncbi:MAG: hypothetical protein DWQ37_17435 [Planctomycetota bacterium]|nr:MAG: hypothetical protein DWQ37_17435 [Planctomycetota bacterium]
MMRNARRATVLVLLAGAIALPVVEAAQAQQAPPDDAPDRALAFLRVEVPKWQQENACFSCHNNGDAARALMAATQADRLDDKLPLAETLVFLASPDRWDENGPDGPFKDKNLARVQFAAALAEAARDRLVARDDRVFRQAAAMLTELQAPDGSWPIGPAGNVGAPATYGQALASLMALRALETLAPEEQHEPIAKARRWFRATEPKRVLDAAATLWALAGADDGAAQRQRRRALELIRRGQSPDGGWGPFVNAPPEVFDTAVVLLALAAQEDHSHLSPLIRKGRRFLIAQQFDDGSWPETTRPRGAESYAQRLSTAGWATLALLATRGS